VMVPAPDLPGKVQSVTRRGGRAAPADRRGPPVAGRGWFGGAGDAIMPETARGAMSDDRRLGFVTYFLRSNPTRTAWMVGLLALAGLSEGIGLATLLPVLELASGEPTRSPFSARIGDT